MTNTQQLAAATCQHCNEPVAYVMSVAMHSGDVVVRVCHMHADRYI